MKIVACGPPSTKSAWVPEVLAVRDGHRVFLVQKDDDETWSETFLDEEIDDGRLTPIGPVPYQHGWWIGIGPDGTSSFPKEEEPRWRLSKASELIRQRDGMTPRPETADSLLSAGALVGVNLAQALETIEANRNDPSESLTDIFLRLRKSGSTS